MGKWHVASDITRSGAHEVHIPRALTYQCRELTTRKLVSLGCTRMNSYLIFMDPLQQLVTYMPPSLTHRPPMVATLSSKSSVWLTVCQSANEPLSNDFFICLPGYHSIMWQKPKSKLDSLITVPAFQICLRATPQSDMYRDQKSLAQLSNEPQWLNIVVQKSGSQYESACIQILALTLTDCDLGQAT